MRDTKIGCEHEVSSWPSIVVTERPPWWKIWGQTYGRLEWRCLRCGAEMEPVYRVVRLD